MKLLKRILPLSFLLTLLFTLNAFAADSSLRFGQPWTDNTDKVLESYTAAVPDATCKAAHGFDFYWVPGVYAYYTTTTNPGTVYLYDGTTQVKRAEVLGTATSGKNYLVRVLLPYASENFKLGTKEFSCGYPTQFTFSQTLAKYTEDDLNTLKTTAEYDVANYDAKVWSLTTPEVTSVGYTCCYLMENQWNVHVKAGKTWLPLHTTRVYKSTKGVTYYGTKGAVIPNGEFHYSLVFPSKEHPYTQYDIESERTITPTVPYDWNKDGYIDHLASYKSLDTNSDGVPDAWDKNGDNWADGDWNGDGIPDEYDRDNDHVVDDVNSKALPSWVDTDNNGKDDRWNRGLGFPDCYDLNNDGIIDRDRNGDGLPDQYDMNNDGLPDNDWNDDGIPDKYELEQLVAKDYLHPIANDSNRDGLPDSFDSNLNSWDDLCDNPDRPIEFSNEFHNDMNFNGVDDSDEIHSYYILHRVYNYAPSPLTFYQEDSISASANLITLNLNYGTKTSGSNASTWKSDSTGHTTYTLRHENGMPIATNKTGHFTYKPTKDERLTIVARNNYGALSRYFVFCRVFSDVLKDDTGDINTVGQDVNVKIDTRWDGDIQPTYRTSTLTNNKNFVTILEQPKISTSYYWSIVDLYEKYDAVMSPTYKQSKTLTKSTYPTVNTQDYFNNLLSNKWSYENKATNLGKVSFRLMHLTNAVYCQVDTPQSMSYAKLQYTPYSTDPDNRLYPDEEGDRNITPIKDGLVNTTE